MIILITVLRVNSRTSLLWTPLGQIKVHVLIKRGVLISLFISEVVCTLELRLGLYKVSCVEVSLLWIVMIGEVLLYCNIVLTLSLDLFSLIH